MLVVILVNYKSTTRTIRYLKEELLFKVSVPFKLVIVDNCSSLKSRNDFIVEFELENNKESYYCNSQKFIYLLPVTENLGFARGNNYGFNFALSMFDFQYILFSNNDIILKSNYIIESLIAKLETDHSIGLIGPRVEGLKGEFQSPEPYYSLFNRYVWVYWLTPFLSKSLKTKLFNLDYPEQAKEGFHYKIMGSFFMMPRDAFMNCGGMDSNTFLFAEEICLSERLNRIGLHCYYLPSVSILHEHSQTISNTFKNWEKNKILFQSEAYYYSTYKHIPQWQLLLAKCSFYLYNYLKQKFS